MRTTRQVLRRSFRAWATDQEDDPGPAWLSWLWTALLALAVAAVFTLLGLTAWWQPARGVEGPVLLGVFGSSLGISATIAFLVHVSFLGLRVWPGRAWMRSLQGWRASALYAGVPTLGLVVGWPLGVTLTLGVRGWRTLGRMPTEALVGGAVVGLGLSLALHVAFALKARELAAEKRATEAQLRLLQAQIEPHFLFNTLAGVVSLVDRDAPRAKAMLESFVDYLRASFSGWSRDGNATLGDEMRRVEAYLAVVRLRMAGRLAVEVDVPEALQALTLPSLLLQPLVENAIVHGLEPRIGGGRVTVRARVDAGCLELRVEDDGDGLDAAATRPRTPGRTPGDGTALANIRDRLQAAFGGDASLAIAPTEPRGTRAVLRLPLEREALRRAGAWSVAA